MAILRATEPTVRPFDRSEYLSGLRSVTAKYIALFRLDGENVTRAALKRLGISNLKATPRPGSRLWDITGRIDLEKALTEVHAEPEGNNDYTSWDEINGTYPVEAEFEAPSVGCLEERVG